MRRRYEVYCPWQSGALEGEVRSIATGQICAAGHPIATGRHPSTPVSPIATGCDRMRWDAGKAFSDPLNSESMRQCLAVDCLLFLFFLFFFAFRSASSLSPRPRIRRPTMSAHAMARSRMMTLAIGNVQYKAIPSDVLCRHPRLDWAVRCGDGGLLSIAHATPPSVQLPPCHGPKWL